MRRFEVAVCDDRIEDATIVTVTADYPAEARTTAIATVAETDADWDALYTAYVEDLGLA